MSGEEVLERISHLVFLHSHDVLEGLLSRGEGLIGRQLDHLGEAINLTDRLLDLGQLTARLVELLFLKEAITGCTFVQDKKLGHFVVFNNKVD